ncbi:MAG TPA: gamma-glutamyl-phosphate reductase, partial [Clostridiales bacterium]|nr:gamma-glutamyl-phosphate reductase [Clostridiales bacterium]
MDYLTGLGIRAKKASTLLNVLDQERKNNIIEACAKALIESSNDILEANRIDIDYAKKNGMKESLIDRLMLSKDRIKAMADGLIELIALPDPIGEV